MYVRNVGATGSNPVTSTSQKSLPHRGFELPRVSLSDHRMRAPCASRARSRQTSTVIGDRRALRRRPNILCLSGSTGVRGSLRIAAQNAGSRTPRCGLASQRVRCSVWSPETVETDHPDRGQGAHIAGYALPDFLSRLAEREQNAGYRAVSTRILEPVIERSVRSAGSRC